MKNDEPQRSSWERRGRRRKLYRRRGTIQVERKEIKSKYDKFNFQEDLEVGSRPTEHYEDTIGIIQLC